MIPNDGVVDASSVPLDFAINLIVEDADHMDLLKWKTKKAGHKVLELLTSVILNKNS